MRFGPAVGVIIGILGLLPALVGGISVGESAAAGDSGLTEIVPGRVVELSGFLTVTGNEPFTEVVLETDSGRHFILSGEKLDALFECCSALPVRIRGRVLRGEGELMPPELKVLSFAKQE